MIRVHDFFKLSEKEIKKLLIGKKVHYSGEEIDTLLSNMGIKGRELLFPDYTQVLKKLWYDGYKTAPGNKLDVLCISNERVEVTIHFEPCKKRVWIYGDRWKWVTPTRPTLFIIVSVEVGVPIMPYLMPETLYRP